MNKTDSSLCLYAEESIQTSTYSEPCAQRDAFRISSDSPEPEIKESDAVDASPIGEESSNEYIPGTFEGPEKTLEVVFHTHAGAEDGLRTLTRVQVDELCRLAKCTILSKMSNSYMDAYVLSESSLFIYKHRFIMKTCGTTTLLRCLNTLLDYADELGMELEWVGYSRTIFCFQVHNYGRTLASGMK